MRELTFFTTNQTKLAHARYLAEGRQINIKGFRQRTYHAGYVEPRLTSRHDILQASYESAKSQLAKAGFSEASHAFILEDTSVCIDALSSLGKEVPGVDIKYWMEGRTFKDLDVSLKAAGNNRNVTVRSDVLLHVPSNFRSSWFSGPGPEYVIFTGQQHGRIVDIEHSFSSNLVYPWLDNKSFNKWFIPDGSDTPLGALPIGSADAVDFRRGSFGSLFDFLESRHYFTISRTQFNFQLDRQVNVILCGYTCSGKTTASQYLAYRHGYLHVEASDFMHLSYYYRHGFPGPTSVGDFAEQALRQQPNIAAEKVAEYVKENLESPIVISGFRSPLEIEFLEGALVASGKKFVRWFINASESTRFSRLLARLRPGDDLTSSQFQERDRQQKRMGLDAIEGSSLCIKVENENSLGTYLATIDVMAEKQSDEIDVAQSLISLAEISDVGLQDAILMALLSVWTNNESRKFYTTTEIAALISGCFPSIRPKHKDNVSRYFNQDFYAFYEISRLPVNDTRRYRLSNTGYGKAVTILRTLVRS